jgi:predicted Zn-dependent protease
MSEQAFKNVTVLKGIPVDEFMDTMGFISASTNYNCIDCHMRRAEPDDQRHTAFTDHWIRKRIEPPPHEVRTSIAFAPTFPETFAAMPPADQSFYRGRIYLLKSLETPASVRGAMWAEAASAFGAAAEKGFSDPALLFFLGKTESNQKRWDVAEGTLREAIRRDPKNRDAAFALGRALVQQRKIGEAASVYEDMLRSDPKDPAALAELASCRLVENRAGEALELYDRSVREDPQNAHLHANRGVILMALGRRDEAARAILEAARLDPEDAAVWTLSARVLAQTGRREEASEADRRARLLTRRPRAAEAAAPTMD